MKKRNPIVFLLIALVAIMFFPACKEETPEPLSQAQGWLDQLQKVMEDANSIETENDRNEYITSNLPKSPILMSDYAMVKAINNIYRENVKTELTQKINELIAKTNDEATKEMWRQTLTKSLKDLDDEYFITTDGTYAVIYDIGIRQDKSGNWHIIPNS